MNIQSFSVVVPNKKCINNCPFCVSRMVKSDSYPNLMDISNPHYDINVEEYLKRMRFVADNGCQTMILTGTSEPQQNRQFLATLALLHRQIGSPFTNIEMQCTGILLNRNRDYLRFLRNFVGVNTVALSISSFDDIENNDLLGHRLPIEKCVNLGGLCALLKEYDFNVRCCFNLSKLWEKWKPEEVLKRAKIDFNADQVTFRKLYSSNSSSSQSKWIQENQIGLKWTHDLKSVLDSAPLIGTTSYGTQIREVNGMSVIYDTDCMGKNPTSDAIKYLILRPNCKLYSSWDSSASLIF